MERTNPVPMTALASTGTLVKTSPCRGCKNRAAKIEPLVCITWDECPLRIEPQAIYAFIDDRARNHRPPTKPSGPLQRMHKCPFEGCTVRTVKEGCYMHRRTIHRRRARGIEGPELYKAGQPPERPWQKKCKER